MKLNRRIAIVEQLQNIINIIINFALQIQIGHTILRLPAHIKRTIE